MSRKKTPSKKKGAKKRKKRNLYSYLFHVSTQPRKFLQPYRTSYCYSATEDRNQALLFLCPRHEIKIWMDWVAEKIHDKNVNTEMRQGGYLSLYIHVVRVHTPDLIVPSPRYGKEFVVKDRLRPRAIVPVRYYYYKRLDMNKLNSILKRLNELKVRV